MTQCKCAVVELGTMRSKVDGTAVGFWACVSCGSEFVPRHVAEHLSDLIKRAEYAGDFCDDPACPWCLASPGGWSGHAADCVAFASKGSVRWPQT